jgi:threonine/homoserine/homoserine lactone efflux protein
MPSFHTLLSFAGVALVMALSPGPNMIYLVSRSICQGRKAGLISLLGVCAGFFFYMISTALGVTAIFVTFPILYELLKIAGACYLFYLAWKALRPGGRSPLQVRQLATVPPSKLFKMGFLTNLFNPKIAMMYLSLLPQFIHPKNGPILSQFLILGRIQIFVGTSVNGIIAISASSISSFLTSKTSWLIIQRWVFGCILITLGLHLLLGHR